MSAKGKAVKGKTQNEAVITECRACLTKVEGTQNVCSVFQPWTPAWDGMEPTIAEDLAKVAHVVILKTDLHSKVLCSNCYQKLYNACTFAASVRTCDLMLKQRYPECGNIDKVWPKPIQVDKQIGDVVLENAMQVEIKQETMSDDEDEANPTESYAEADLEIKIEPEEFVQPAPMQFAINGTTSLHPSHSNATITNGTEEYGEEQYLDLNVKPEPKSEEESDPVLDLPLECMLCTKSFNSVDGLKAHVIAEHSYKSVKRKDAGVVTPEKKTTDKYKCEICRRNFTTSTDLLVHETCHNKHTCFACTKKFDSFAKLTKHRKYCRALRNKGLQKPKTLEDVKRSVPQSESQKDSSDVAALPALTITSFETSSLPAPNTTSLESAVIPDISITSSVSVRTYEDDTTEPTLSNICIASTMSLQPDDNAETSDTPVLPDISITSSVSLPPDTDLENSHSIELPISSPHADTEQTSSQDDENMDCMDGLPDISIISTVSLREESIDSASEQNSVVSSEAYIIPDMDTPSAFASQASNIPTLDLITESDSNVPPSESNVMPKISLASLASLQSDVNMESLELDQESENYIVPDNVDEDVNHGSSISTVLEENTADLQSDASQLDTTTACGEAKKSGAEDSNDSNMKLHLEIHSSKSDSETPDLSDVDMQVETLHSDDCS